MSTYISSFRSFIIIKSLLLFVSVSLCSSMTSRSENKLVYCLVMSPPIQRECYLPECEYKTAPGFPTHDLLMKDLEFHIRCAHRGYNVRSLLAKEVTSFAKRG